MKPKNKFQKRVVEASKHLAPISEKQTKWAYKNCIEHKARRLKNGTVSCLECGHTWQGKTTKAKHCICPNCKAKLMFVDTQKRVFKQEEYFCIITVCGGFQVLRSFYVICNAKVGEKAHYYHYEVVQRWIAPNGKYATMARLRTGMFGSCSWSFHIPIEIRPDKPLYNIIPTSVYTHQSLIPKLRKSGYNKSFYGLTPFEMFQSLLADSWAETLLKAGQVDLLRYFAKNSRGISRYWTSIRICMRNAYKANDVSIWCDYIDLLRFFEKDLHNAKFVCPVNLTVEHDRYVEKKRTWQKKQNEKEAKKKALENEAFFKEMKAKFFGLCFTDGRIKIKMLDSVKQVIQEGEIMHHCVFTNDYHLKEDSLILSACANDEKLETVEVSLSKFEVLESRGACNENTEHHERIINLVNKNMHLIQKRITA